MNVRTARSLFGIFLLAALACANTCISALGATPRELPPPGLADGPGVWANVWNYPTGDLDAYLSSLRSYGVRNLFIQTTRVNMPAIAHGPELGALIDACHRHRIRVIGWAYFELHDPVAEADKMLAAARFRSPNGEMLDGVAPDLEKNLTSAKVEAFSQRLRDALGPSYPLIARVYSPLNHYSEVKNIPWQTLARYYDVIAPMAYWNSKYQKLDAYDYTVGTVRTIREMCGRPDIEVHVIGDAMGSGSSAIIQFMKACRKAEATSASIYPNQRPTAEQLAALSRYPEYFEPNSRFRLAAFRQLLRNGSVTATPGMDPTEPISRADFYRLVARHLHAPVPPIETSSGAQAPIYSDEALTVLARLVEIHQVEHGKRKRADRWFAPPAMAEATQNHAPNDRPLNLLDASEMLLQVSSALR